MSIRRRFGALGLGMGLGGGGGAILRFIIDLSQAVCVNATGRTVLRGGLIVDVPPNTPAMTDDALDVDDASENISLHSEAFDNVYWVKVNSGITADQVIAPDGETTADLVTPSSANGYTTNSSQISGDINGIEHTISIWARAVAGTKDVVYGLLKEGDALLGNDTAVLTTTWQRLEVAVTPAIATVTYGIYIQSQTNTDGFYIWGGQLELGGVATSYKKTEAGTTSTDADVNTTVKPAIWDDTFALEGTFTPKETGQTAVEFSSYTDADNYTALMINATDLTLRKRVAATNYDAVFTYTHEVDKQTRYRIYGDATGTGIAVADASADISVVAFITNANALLAIFAATVAWGHLNGGSIFASTIDNTGEPIADTSKETAGW